MSANYTIPSEDFKEFIKELVKYMNNSQEENKQLKEQVDRLIKKEYEKNNNYIVKVRTGEQLEREQYLLNFKSKSMLASMLIDTEERIDKAIELTKKLLEADEIEIDGIKYYKGNADDLVAKKYLEILGDRNE